MFAGCGKSGNKLGGRRKESSAVRLRTEFNTGSAEGKRRREGREGKGRRAGTGWARRTLRALGKHKEG
jgi:hypothetical protein